MDIKEGCICGAVVVGGAAFGFSQMGLNDALSSELKHVSEVSLENRIAYMSEVVSEFSESFDTYEVQTDSYYYQGLSDFSANPARAMFVEVVKQENAVPTAELEKLKAAMSEDAFCAQDEMTMFTDAGWSYRFTLKDEKRQIVRLECRPKTTAGQA